MNTIIYHKIALQQLVQYSLGFHCSVASRSDFDPFLASCIYALHLRVLRQHLWAYCGGCKCLRQYYFPQDNINGHITRHMQLNLGRTHLALKQKCMRKSDTLTQCADPKKNVLFVLQVSFTPLKEAFNPIVTLFDKFFVEVKSANILTNYDTFTISLEDKLSIARCGTHFCLMWEWFSGIFGVCIWFCQSRISVVLKMLLTKKNDF